jgi:uncharacterized damage-inducible protein DinB
MPAASSVRRAQGRVMMVRDPMSESTEDIMTYYGGRDLAAGFRTVRKNTVQIAEDIPEGQYGLVAAEGVRSVARMLVHVALSPRLFWQDMHQTRPRDVSGFDYFGAMRRIEAEEAAPRTKAQILELLAQEGEGFATFLEGWSEEELAEPIPSPVAKDTLKSRFEMLMSAKEHEMHHRAQLMLIERQLGIVPHLTRQMNAMIERMTRAAGR